MELHYHIVGGDFVNAGQASSSVKGVLKQLNVASHRIKRLVIALYEAEVNVVAHAYRGGIKVVIEPARAVIEVKDEGPGIENIDQAMQEGFSTASPRVREMGFGAGMGLPNIKRNSDDFAIESTPGEGTVLRIINHLRD